MADDNSGTIGVGQRLSNIEGMLKEALEQIATERHRVNNLLAEKTLSEQVLQMVKDHERRLTDIERNNIAEDAVAKALAEYQEAQALRQDKQTANIKWGIGILSSLGIVNIFIQAMN